MQTSRQDHRHIPEIPGMAISPSPSVHGGLNCSFGNGFVATVAGEPDDPEHLVFISKNGEVLPIEGLTPVRDMRDDDKRFLNNDEIFALLTAMSRQKK